MSEDSPEKRLTGAAAKNNWGLVDNLCRNAIEDGNALPYHWYWLARTAEAFGAHDHAQRYVKRAFESEPNDSEIRSLRVRLVLHRRLTASKGVDPRFLVIREFGGGFWADVLHTLSYLHIADYSGRIPITYWGVECRFTDNPKIDAFTTFFEPASPLSLIDLPAKLIGVYPERWSAIPIAANHPRDVRLGWKPVYLPSVLFRHEQLVVGDYFGWPIELFAWTQKSDRIDR